MLEGRLARRGREVLLNFKVREYKRSPLILFATLKEDNTRGCICETIFRVVTKDTDELVFHQFPRQVYPLVCSIRFLPFRPMAQIHRNFRVIHALSCLIYPLIPNEPPGPISAWMKNLQETETEPSFMALASMIGWSAEKILTAKKFVMFTVLLRDLIRGVAAELDKTTPIVLDSRPVPCNEEPWKTYKETDCAVVCYSPAFSANWNTPRRYQTNRKQNFVRYAAMEQHGVTYVVLDYQGERDKVVKIDKTIEEDRMESLAGCFCAVFYVREDKFPRDFFGECGALEPPKELPRLKMNTKFEDRVKSFGRVSNGICQGLNVHGHMSSGADSTAPTPPVSLGLRIGVMVVCSVAVIVGIALWIFAIVTKRREKLRKQKRGDSKEDEKPDIEEMIAEDPEIEDDSKEEVSPPGTKV